jgi:diguanylate cyclase (GGDEF)-like protein/PAS domain S-box-containing protein
VSRTAWKTFLLCAVAVITAAMPFGETARGIACLIVSIMAIAAVWIGLRAWQPADKWPWRSFGGAISIFTIALVVRAIMDPNDTAQFTAADVIDMLGYLACVVSAVLLLRKRSHGKDPTNLLDALIGVSGGAVLAWVFLVLPYLNDPRVTDLERTRESIFIVETLILGLMIARLSIGPGARNPSYYLLAVGAFGAVAIEVVVSLQLSGHGFAGLDLPLIVGPYSYAAVGCAALHPSMRELTRRATEPIASITRGRLLMMGFAVVIPPAMLLVKSSSARSGSDFVIILAWAAIGVMVMVRLTGMARARERSAHIEQVLSRAAAGLVASTDPDEMYRTAVDSTALLSPRVVLGHISVVRIEDDRVRRLASSGTRPDALADHTSRTALAPALLDALVGSESVVLADTATPDAPEQPWASVLVAPLVSRTSHYGAIVVTAGRPLDVVTIDAVANLASDLALALATAELAAEMHRQRSERRFRALIENADEVITVVTPRGEITFVSPAVTRLLGYAESDVIGRRVEEFLFEGDMDVLRQRLTATDSRRTPMEIRFRHASGKVRWFELVIADLLDTPEVQGIVVTARDIGDRKEAAARLAKSEARFRALVQHSADVVAVLDGDGLLNYVSSSATRVLGYQIDTLLDRDIEWLVHTDDREVFHRLFATTLADPRVPHTSEARVRDNDGMWRTLELTLTDLRADPTVEGVVLNAHDITARKLLELDLRHQALHDELTGLPNRILFRDRVQQALTTKVDELVAVLIIDLDDFKTINDAVGHPVGDKILRVVSTRLQQQLRSEDTAARLGGDEFSIVIDGAKNREDVLLVARRILGTLRAPIDLGGLETRVEASIGVVFDVDCTEPTPEILLRNADMAMYSAKGKGKGRVSTYDESMHVGVFERLELKADLAKAVDLDQLVLHYQPIVDLTTGRIKGFEALMRWAHPERGMISPGSFIPLAEETGMIVPMGRWLMETAFSQLAQWQRAFSAITPLTMSVNLSPRQLEDPQVVSDVSSSLRRYGLDPHTVTIELTESDVVDGGSIRHDRITEICALGVNVVADDFGSGYASYAALSHLPFNGDKLDMSLIEGLIGDGADRVRAQVRAILAMAASTNLTVVAEGIESGEQVAALNALGCPMGQGYYFSRPLPPPGAAELLRTQEYAPTRS